MVYACNPGAEEVHCGPLVITSRTTSQGEPCLMKEGLRLPRNEPKVALTRACSQVCIRLYTHVHVSTHTWRDHRPTSTLADFCSLLSSPTPLFFARSTLQTPSIRFLGVRFPGHELWGYTPEPCRSLHTSAPFPAVVFPLSSRPGLERTNKDGSLNVLLRNPGPDAQPKSV